MLLELTAVGRRVQAHEEGVGEAECRGEAEESCDEKKNLPKSEGLDADQNHTDYGYYKHRSCQAMARRGWEKTLRSAAARSTESTCTRTGRQQTPWLEGDFVSSTSCFLMSDEGACETQVFFRFQKVWLEAQCFFVVSNG